MSNALKYKVEVSRAVELARTEMLTSPGLLIPRLYAFPPLGVRFPPLSSLGLQGLDAAGQMLDEIMVVPFDPGLMQDWSGKNLIGMGIVRILFQAKARVIVFLGEARRAQPAPGKTFADYPRNLADWPKGLVHDALLVNVNAIGMRGYGLSYGYTRDGKGRRVFDATEPEATLDEGRFCYDLTQATEESAMLDALHRNRDGRLEATA